LEGGEGLRERERRLLGGLRPSLSGDECRLLLLPRSERGEGSRTTRSAIEVMTTTVPSCRNVIYLDDYTETAPERVCAHPLLHLFAEICEFLPLCILNVETRADHGHFYADFVYR